jgi:hypothetical protein
MRFIWFTSQYYANNPLSTQIKYLYESGIIQDIKAAKYMIKPTCIDSNGVERAATTLKVNLNLEKPEFESPEICLNVRMLSQIGNTTELAALLLHEHARHYGLEDTEPETGIHPLSEFYVKSLEHTEHMYFNTVKFDNFAYYYGADRYRQILTTKRSTYLNLKIEKLNGDCSHFLLNIRHLL